MAETTNVAMTDLFGEDSSDEEEQQPPAESESTEKAVKSSVKQEFDSVHEDHDQDNTQLNTHNPLLMDNNMKRSSGSDSEEDRVLPPRNVTMMDVLRPLDVQDENLKRGNQRLSIHSTKLPTIIGIQPTAFDKEAFDPDVEEEKYKGNTRNLMRWRYKRDENNQLIRDPTTNKLIRESNTRFIKVFLCDI